MLLGEMGKTTMSVTSLNSTPPVSVSRSFTFTFSHLLGRDKDKANASSDSELNSQSLVRLSLVGPRRLESIKDLFNGPIDAQEMAESLMGKSYCCGHRSCHGPSTH